ncbi:MAG TPA: hypothetical protein VGU61_19940 [Noviherbaspirillum sp.]|jgi:hypothetical protein|uniref:hypothetical protein n=1 Tax=Noviherbaspirillum sp. TaxID=1926288 RepID=UPI002DDD381C|nr:hypothetical protein [Noviherbaspirillum sp.]HEV2612544.1 hypothetical protein [Noviherbaspirillum sp.]
MSDLKAQLEFTANADGVEAGVSKAKRSLTSLGETAEKVGKQTADGLEKMGSGGEKAAAKVDKTTKNLAESIQRATAAMNAGAKGSAEYYAALANTRGADAKVLAPYLAALKEAADRTKIAAEANKKLEESTRFLDNLRNKSDSIGKTASELAALRAAQLGVSDAAGPMIAKMRAAEEAAERAGKGMSRFGAAALNAIGAFATIQTVISAMNKLGAAVDRLDKFDELSQKLSINAKTLQELAYAGKMSGIELDVMAASFKKLQTNMFEATTGGKEQAAVFKAMGVAITDAAGNLRATEDVLGDVAEVFSGLEDGATKTALAVKLFGKSGTDLIPTLNEGRAGLAKLTEEAQRLGAVMGSDAIKNAAEFNDNLDRMRTLAASAANGLASNMIPALNNVIERFLAATKHSGSFIEQMKIAAGITVRGAFGQDYGDQIRATDRQIALLETRKELSIFGKGALDEDIKKLQTVRKSLQEMQSLRALEGSDGYADASDRRAAGGSTGASASSIAAVLRDSKDTGGKGGAATISEYDKLVASSTAFIENLKLEAAQVGLTNNQVKMMAAAKAAAQAPTEALRKAIMESALALEIATTRREELTEAERAAAAIQKRFDDNADRVLEQVRALERELDTYGLIGSAVTDLSIAKTQAALQSRELNEGEVRSLELQLSALQRLKDLQLDKEERDASAKIAADALKAADAAAKEWQRASSEIERSLTDALLRGFESGKGFGKNLVDSLKNMFKTLVLRPVISAVMNPIAGGIQNMIGGAIGQAATGAVGQVAASAGGSMVGSLLGNAAGLLSPGGTGLGGLLAGGGVLGPLALGIGAILAIHKATKGETRAGGQYGYSFDGRSVINNRRGEVLTAGGIGAQFLEGPSGGDPYAKEAKAAINGTVDSINAVLKAVGSQASLVGFQAAYETSGKGRGGVFAGGRLSTGAMFGESGEGSNYEGTLYESTSTQSPDAQTAIANFATDLKQATIQALQAANDIPKAIADVVANIDAEALSDDAAGQLLTTIDNITKGVTLLREGIALLPFDNLAGLSFDAAANLIKLAGGIDALAGGTSAFVQNFYTEAERMAKVAESVEKQMAALGQSSVDTKEEFRALVEGLDLAREADAKLYVELMKLAPAFASVEDYAKQAAEAVEETVKETVDAAKALNVAAAERLAMLERERDAIEEANAIIGDLSATLESLAKPAARAAMASNTYGLTAQEQEKFGNFVGFLDQANDALADIVALGFPAAMAAQLAEAQNLMREGTRMLVAGLVPDRLRAGNGAGALGAQMMVDGPDPSGYFARGDISGYNRAAILARARTGSNLAGQASADALNIQNVAQVIRDLMAPTRDEDLFQIVRKSVSDGYGIGQPGRSGAGLFDLLNFETQRSIEDQYLPTGPGIAGVQRAQILGARAGSDAGLTEYNRAISQIKQAHHIGALTADEYAEALEVANEIGEKYIISAEDRAFAVEAAARNIQRAGLDSIAYYFDQIGQSVAAMTEAAAAANEPIALATAAIGRLTSTAYVFGESAKAAQGGDFTASENASVRNAALVAEAAKIAAAAMTTQDAARVAEQLKGKDAFKGLGSDAVRDVSLLLDGVREYDSASFEKAFAKINNALANGTLSEGQYAELFSLGLELFTGPDKEANKLTDAFASLRKAAESLADSLLVDDVRSTLNPQQMIAEARRQYEEAVAGSRNGDTDAIAKLDGVTRNLLDVLQANAASGLEYKTSFAGIIATLRELEKLNGGPVGSKFALPGFAVGTNYLPQDMALYAHEGERIVPAADNRAIIAALRGNSGNDKVEARLAQLEAVLRDISAETRASAQHGSRLTKLIERAMPDGDALAIREATT